MNIDNLPPFEIKGSLKVIDTRAFSGCSMLSFPLPESLERLGAWAFSGCLLDNVTIPPKIETIPIGCFQDCISLNEESFAHVKHIEDMAFESGYINEINLPEGVETIGRYAFTGVGFIHLPASLREIDKGFFLDEEWENQSIPYAEVAIDNPFFFDKTAPCTRKENPNPTWVVILSPNRRSRF